MEPVRASDGLVLSGFVQLSDRERVRGIIKERSFGRGKITLASGKESNFYFDMKPTMFDPEGASLLAALIFERLIALNVDYVGGLAVGAVPLLSPLAALSFEKGKPIPGFFVRKEIKDHGTRRRIEGLDNLEGKRVAILDDVTTSGGSAMIAVDAARAAGAAVILVLSVVDREEGAEAFFNERNVPFEAIFKASEFLAS